MLLPVLYDEGIVPLIYTRDPSITESFVKMLTAGNDKIRILKKSNLPDAENVVYRKISAGMATLGDKTSLINTILMAKKYEKLQSRVKIAELSLMIAGGLGAVILSVVGTAIPPIAFGVWQTAFCAILHFISKKTFSFVDKRSENDVEEE